MQKPVFANLKPGQSMETISFEEALELFKLPRDLGKHENQDVTIGSGRFGPYVKFGEQFISIPKNLDPLEISKETAIEIIKQKQKKDAPIGYYKELPVTKGTGRFGPFVKWNGIFVNVPKRINFEKLNLDDVKPLIDAKEVKEANRFILKFDEDKITVENGRWGPYIKYGKKLINFPKKEGQRITADQAAKMTLEDIKSIIQEQIPTAFVKKERKKKAK